MFNNDDMIVDVGKKIDHITRFVDWQNLEIGTFCEECEAMNCQNLQHLPCYRQSSNKQRNTIRFLLQSCRTPPL